MGAGVGEGREGKRARGKRGIWEGRGERTKEGNRQGSDPLLYPSSGMTSPALADEWR